MKQLDFIRRAATALALMSIAAAPRVTLAAEAASGTLVDKFKGTLENKTIEGLLVDNAAGNVPAATLAGVNGDSLNVVENIRDFSMFLGALDSSSKGFGLSITPARTTFPFPAISLRQYNESLAWRLAGSFTIGYAQGKESLSGTDFTRRAVSLSVSAFPRSSDDPVVAIARASSNGQSCAKAAFDKIPDDGPGTSRTQAEIDRIVAMDQLETDASKGDAIAIKALGDLRRKADGGDAQAIKDLQYVHDATRNRQALAGDPAAQREILEQATRPSKEIEKQALAAYNTCVEEFLKEHAKKWNRSRFSLSYATGAIKPTGGSGSSESLGQSLALSALYGFDGIPALQQRAAITVSVRRTNDEPVLSSLSSSLVTKNSTLAAIRLSGGSSVFRGLVEANNAKQSEVTSTQRTLRRALGVDLRVMDGLWLNLRYGKQRKIDGTGDETASFLVLNYSPSALLGH